MPQFTESEQNTIKILLGYGSISNTITNELKEQETDELLAQARAIIAELASIDTQLSAARSDSMAQGVGNLKLSYAQHVAHLKSEGTRYLRELSRLLGLAIVYNKYRGQSASKACYW